MTSEAPRAVAANDHLASGAVLKLAEREAGGRDLTAERAAAMEIARRRLSEEAEGVKWDIDRAMNYASFSETALGTSRAKIAAIDFDRLPAEAASAESREGKSSAEDFPQAVELLARAKEEVAAAERRALERAYERINALESKASAEDVAQLRRHAEIGDLITLMEELPLVERGQPLIEPTSPEDTLRAFGMSLRAAHEADDATARLRALVQDRDGSAGERTVAIARAWEELINQRPGAGSVGQLKNALTQLGFAVERVSEERLSGRIRIYGVRLTTAIADRKTCAVARFGSLARGAYELVLAETSATPDEMIRAVAEASKAVLLIVRGALKFDNRMQIVRLARDRETPLCLIDTELILFAARRARPLADVFACGVPFGAVSPYSIEPGSIPVEIFFGRDVEIASVRDPGGSNIVYGGRQLGKSVMLDHLATTQHKRERFIVRRVDCQARVNRAADVWQVIADTLDEEGVKAQRPATAATVRAAVRRWLDEAPVRRILILLDETNEFVLRDAEHNSQEVVALRGLMEDTQRRFKVVLSGQHNVLRLANNPNTPLAHFGEPIVIGPLKGPDLKAARALVTDPLAAVGFEFADSRIVSRVLAETQYYPKLVQLLCDNLLKHLRKHKRFDDLPPWRIDGADLDAVLRNADIRAQLFRTFKITLELDKRYELISLIFASNLYARRDQRETDPGFSLQQVLEDALAYWPQGFPAGNKRDTVHALLDELVGLGVLVREDRSGTYRLASPIVGQMIGSQAEVENRLLSFERETPPPSIDPDRRRNTLAPRAGRAGVKTAHWANLSPLAPGQIGALLGARGRTGNAVGVSVVFGAPAMHLGRVIDALAEAPGVTIRDYGAGADRAQFARSLTRASEWKGATIVVRPETHWDAEWIYEARRAKLSGANFVFVGDGALAWRYFVEARDEEFPQVGVETPAPLSSAEIEDQLRRHNITADARELHETTGGFLSPLAEIVAGADSARLRDKFRRSDLAPVDYGAPDIATARRALAEIVAAGLDVASMDDLEIVLLDVDGAPAKRVARWLTAIGLAEPERAEGDGTAALRLNSILTHPSLRERLASG